MMTYLLMGLFLIIYMAVVVFGMKKRTTGDSYFGIDDTTVLKGLWCIIVILVHVPAAYQNRIQDMVGSFAYIGVTFFFMTSAYGLKYGMAHKENYLHDFWRKRLPKILVPAILVNILDVLNSSLLGGAEFKILSLININRWVQVLLLFYLAFWLANSIKVSDKLCVWGGYLLDAIVCIVVITYSLVGYFSKERMGLGWPTESLGFMYGLIFSRIVDRYVSAGMKNWHRKLWVSIVMGQLLGVAYLKYKPVVFYGEYLLKILLGIALTHVIFHYSIKYKMANKVSRFLGGISYEVYLLHGVVFSFLRNTAAGLQSDLYIILAVIMTIVISVVIKRISVKIVDNLW